MRLPKLSLVEILLSSVVIDSLIRPSLPIAILGVSLVSLELFRYWYERKQKEADLKAFEEAFAKYKEVFDGKVSALDSRMSSFLALRR